MIVERKTGQICSVAIEGGRTEMDLVLNELMDLVVPPASMPSPGGVTSQPANAAQGGSGGQGAFLPSANALSQKHIR